MLKYIIKDELYIHFYYFLGYQQMDGGLGHIFDLKPVCDLCQDRWSWLWTPWRESPSFHLPEVGYRGDQRSDQRYSVSNKSRPKIMEAIVNFEQPTNCNYLSILETLLKPSTTSMRSTLAFGAGHMVAMQLQWLWPMTKMKCSSVQPR